MRILVDHLQHGYKGLGDIVCEMAFYPALRRRYPQAVIASRNCRSLAWGQPEIDCFDIETADGEFDLVLRVPDYTPVMRSLTARTISLQVTGGRIFEHFLASQGLEPTGDVPRLFVLPSEMEELGLEDDGEDGLIVAYSIDSREVDRRWGRDRFAALLSHLERTYGVSLIELGSGYSAGHLGLGLDMVGSTTLRQTMAALSLADLFIGNHGGLTHLAGGVGTPILAPWGASAPYAPYAYDDLSVAVEMDPTCRHCIWTRRMLPECRQADPMVGNTPCVQAITVEQMIAAAEGLLPRLQERRSELREQKAARRAMARDPRRLGHFEMLARVSPFTHLYQVHGGVKGWEHEHASDNFARLVRTVMCPDWRDPEEGWRQALEAYFAAISADAPCVLLITAAPLTGPEIMQKIESFIQQQGRMGTAPKLAIVLGGLTVEERAALIGQANAYL